MAVQPDEAARRGDRRARSTARGGVAVAEVEAELRVVLAGGDVLVGVGVHAGRDAQQHVGHGGAGGVERVEAVELVEAVDDDVAHAGLDRHAQLVDALVVAVQRARRRRHAGGQRDVQLAAAGHVEQHPLLVGEAGHRPAQERLRRVDRPAGVRTPRPPRGTGRAGGPRRRRTPACRTRRPARRRGTRRSSASRRRRPPPCPAAGCAARGSLARITRHARRVAGHRGHGRRHRRDRRGEIVACKILVSATRSCILYRRRPDEPRRRCPDDPSSTRSSRPCRRRRPRRGSGWSVRRRSLRLTDSPASRRTSRHPLSHHPSASAHGLSSHPTTSRKDTPCTSTTCCHARAWSTIAKPRSVASSATPMTPRLLAGPVARPDENASTSVRSDTTTTLDRPPPPKEPNDMYAIHPIVTQQLVETRARELHRIAGQTRLHRETIHPRPLRRRRP